MNNDCNKSAEVNGPKPFAGALGSAAMRKIPCGPKVQCRVQTEEREVMMMMQPTIIIEDIKIQLPSNAGTQRPGTPDGPIATETRKPGSLK